MICDGQLPLCNFLKLFALVSHLVIVQAIVQILLPMAGPRVREALSYAFSQVFREYTNAIASQFTHYRYADSTLPKVLGKLSLCSVQISDCILLQHSLLRY